jgi:hypothetical protein
MSGQGGQVLSDPRQSRTFRFTRCGYDPGTRVARLGYRFEDGPELTERITFPHAPWPPEASRQSAFEGALGILHLLAGVSYYKAGLSPEIDTGPNGLDERLAAFLTDVYVQGLAEFAYVNGADVAGRVCFPVSGAEGAAASPLVLPGRALVAMGGGKDSIVGLELLREAGVEVQPVCVGGSQLIGDTVRAAGLPLLRIERTLAPELREMNRAGAWNGHVPVTAINSAILVCAAILYGFRYVVFSNERSADEATLTAADGTAVNHQYSKTSAFESAFSALVASHISPDIEYFSVLRPFSELGVVQRFSRMKPFHSVFSSCNRHFHLDGPRLSGRWCLDCPKCRFAALGLALFLSPGELRAIQGGDLLDDPAQEEGFRALCELGVDKPFECVGAAGESRAALAALGASDEWGRHHIVQSLLPDVLQAGFPPLEDLLRPLGNHHYPPAIAAALERAAGIDALR